MLRSFIHHFWSVLQGHFTSIELRDGHVVYQFGIRGESRAVMTTEHTYNINSWVGVQAKRRGLAGNLVLNTVHWLVMVIIISIQYCSSNVEYHSFTYSYLINSQFFQTSSQNILLHCCFVTWPCATSDCRARHFVRIIRDLTWNCLDGARQHQREESALTHINSLSFMQTSSLVLSCKTEFLATTSWLR